MYSELFAIGKTVVRGLLARKTNVRLNNKSRANSTLAACVSSLLVDELAAAAAVAGGV